MPIVELSGEFGGVPEIRGTLGPFVTTSAPLALPATLQNELVSLEFVADAVAGARLRAITCTAAGAAAHEWTMDPEGLGRTGALWELRGTLEAGGSFTLRPEHATEPLEVWDAVAESGAPALVFVWRSVAVAGSLSADSFDVSLLVELAAGDPVARARVFVNRSPGAGAGASLDEVDVLPVAVRGPLTARVGETHAAAQMRARLLIPTNNESALPAVLGPNSPAGVWCLGVAATLAHPAGGAQIGPVEFAQVLQFSALYAADTTDPAYGHMLVLGTEDRTGHLKLFEHRGATSGSGNGVVGWKTTAFPGFAGLPSPDGPAPDTEWGNVYRSPYPVTLAAIVAPSEPFWFWACELYRRFTDRAGLGGLNRTLRADRSALGVDGNYHGQISFLGSVPGQPARYLELHRVHRAALDNPHHVPKSFLMWTNWKGDGSNELETPTNPPVAFAEVPAACDLATSRGWHVFLYTQPRIIDRGKGWEPFIPDRAEWHARDGSKHGAPGGIYLDFGAPEAQALWPEHVVPAILAATRAGGVYCDGWGGHWCGFAFDPAAGASDRQHAAAGGDYWQRGKRAMSRALRAVLQERSGFGAGDTDAPIVVEAADEFGDENDLCQQGYVLPPWLLELEAGYYGGAIDGAALDVAARDPSPPLFEAVYGDRIRLGRLVNDLTDVGLDSNALFATVAYPGMTADEWRAFHCWVWASNWITGQSCLAMTHLGVGDVDRPMLKLAAPPTPAPGGDGGTLDFSQVENSGHVATVD